MRWHAVFRVVGAAAVVVAAALAGAGCASVPWPDEPGRPVEPSRAANLQAADQFFDALTARRRAANLPPPVVAGRLQLHFERIAEALQRGDLSAAAARREALRWGRETYKRDVDAWLVDCTAGAATAFPSLLLDRPIAVISFAAARFRPRSLSADQCAVIVLAVTGAVDVRLEAP